MMPETVASRDVVVVEELGGLRMGVVVGRPHFEHVSRVGLEAEAEAVELILCLQTFYSISSVVLVVAAKL